MTVRKQCPASKTNNKEIKLPPLLCMTLSNSPGISEYRNSFTSKQCLVRPGVKLAPSFLYLSPRNFVARTSRATRQPGFVSMSNSGALSNYNYLHSGTFYHSIGGTKPRYFTLATDWISEKQYRKSNPFS